MSALTPGYGPPPSDLPAHLPDCSTCRHMVWEGPILVRNAWDAMHCGRWREEKLGGLIRGRPQKACWWERYGGIGRCGAAGTYYQPDHVRVKAAQ